MVSINTKKNQSPLQELGWCRGFAIALTTLIGYLGLRSSAERRKMLCVAAAIALAWVWWYGYDYSCKQFIVGGVNVMTWSAWTLGLFVAGVFYATRKAQGIDFWKRIALIAGLWFAVMLAIEYVGYNWCKIQLKSNYPGLFGLPLMHGPWYLKIFYLFAWVLYFTLLGLW
jgi:hypothetical protein